MTNTTTALRASPAQLLYGTKLRVPGEFFVSESLPADPNFFLEKFRDHMRRARPTTAAHHTKARFFVLKDLYDGSHVFVRGDAVKKPFDPPYTGPHEIVRRVDDRVFIVKFNGLDKTISVDQLKTAFITKTDSLGPSPEQQHQPIPQLSASTTVPEEHHSLNMDPPLRTYARVTQTPKKVSFLSLPILRSLGGEWLWRLRVN
ncbi:uncharacterized protein LOC107037784 [Diachasma alloeum]|uniref:uncharacterized protein LOC107037784 n=1 Tax=Diachasma alloeum TaxID=454923 RepID=UPI00073825A5|nr:uncharacterized protein LOC107037784 [Diachasma alloeum]XP_028981917.1 uncharacterized protein LOC107037784 [Diachasma alloeum]